MALGCEANVTQSGSRDGNAEYLVKAMRTKMSIESPQYLVRLIARAVEQAASMRSDIEESLAELCVLCVLLELEHFERVEELLQENLRLRQEKDRALERVEERGQAAACEVVSFCLSMLACLFLFD